MADFEATARALLLPLSDLPSGPPQHRCNTTFPITDEPFYELLDPSPINPSDGAQDRVVSVGVAAQPGEIEAGRRAVQEVGLDILAFYKSFRFIDRPPLRGKWGIFIIDQGIATVAAAFRATLRESRRERRITSSTASTTAKKSSSRTHTTRTSAATNSRIS